MNGAKQTPEINTYPEINIYIYYKLMFDERYSWTHCGEKTISSINCIEKTGVIHMQKNETRPYLTHIQKSTQSRLKFLNIWSEILKLLKENI